MRDPLNFERLVVDPAVENHAQTLAIVSRLTHQKSTAHLQPELLGEDEVRRLAKQLRWQDDEIAAGKKILWLTKGKGKGLHHCPGTKKAYCCNFYVLDLVENCPYDCTYCYLQNHLTNPLMRINVNIEDFLAEIRQMLEFNGDRDFRVGTGELSDSLAMESITHHGKQLVEFASQFDNLRLELKTKSNQVDELLQVDPRGCTVIGWSINPRDISLADEHLTATIDERFAAAEKVIAAGYLVAFHFDPIIRVPGWNFKYLSLIKEITARFSANDIAWISLGTLRFPKGLQKTVLQRFPRSQIGLDEFIEGVDHKQRYPAIKRADAYQRMMSWIHDRWPDTPLYMCMESPEIWHRLTGGKPRRDTRLKSIYG